MTYSPFTEEERRKTIDEIIAFFSNERDEEIGVVAAGVVLDFFLSTFGVELYKKGIRQAQDMLKNKLEDLDNELDYITH